MKLAAGNCLYFLGLTAIFGLSVMLATSLDNSYIGAGAFGIAGPLFIFLAYQFGAKQDLSYFRRLMTCFYPFTLATVGVAWMITGQPLIGLPILVLISILYHSFQTILTQR